MKETAQGELAAIIADQTTEIADLKRALKLAELANEMHMAGYAEAERAARRSR